MESEEFFVREVVLFLEFEEIFCLRFDVYIVEKKYLELMSNG